MDSDRIKGIAKQAEGKLQEAKGSLTGSSKDKAQGEAKQVTGKAQEAIGKAKDKARKILNENP